MCLTYCGCFAIGTRINSPRGMLIGSRLHRRCLDHLGRGRERVRRFTVSKQRLNHRTIGRRGRGNASFGGIVRVAGITGVPRIILLVLVINIIVVIIIIVQSRSGKLVMVAITIVVVVMVEHLLRCPWHKVAIGRSLVSKVVGSPNAGSGC